MAAIHVNVEPPKDRNFLARTVTFAFIGYGREWRRSGFQWVEAWWREDDQKYCIWTGDPRSQTTEDLELTAWAELPGNG